MNDFVYRQLNSRVLALGMNKDVFRFRKMKSEDTIIKEYFGTFRLEVLYA